MGTPKLPWADVMSRRGSRHAAARLRMSQAEKPAAPVHLESNQHANTRPAGEPGRRSKGPQRKSGVVRGECPSRAPDWGGPSPGPQHPTWGSRECPALLPSHPNSPWHPWDRKMKSGRSEAFFKHTFFKTTHIQEG